MMKYWQFSLMGSALLTAALGSTAARAEVMVAADGTTTPQNNAMAQVTSVSQLSDVRPTDWAFQALQSLVERYGCIAGYPDRTYRGNRAMTRYEFAAGLNACMDRVNELIAAATNDLASKQDLAKLQKLQEEFAAELATLRGRVGAVEAKVATLEKQQFSTTTKLQGEVVFAVADTFGKPDNTNAVLQDRVRLQMVTSFTGKDKLYTRLTAGNFGTSFAATNGTQEGRFAYDGSVDNTVAIDRLHYVFPLGKKLTVTAMANTAGHWFYSDTFNPGLEAGGGGTGALSRFGERNAIYRFGALGQGVGVKYALSDQIEVTAGYLAGNGSNPVVKSGLFNGRYSALGQIVFKPSKQLKVGLTYANNYDPKGQFNFGGTGTNVANGIRNLGAINSNAYGVEGQFDLSPKLSVRGWGTYTNANVVGTGKRELWSYALALAFPDLGKKGNMGAIIVGAEPYLTTGGSATTPLHVEALYKYKVNNNVMITPGVIWLTEPNQVKGANDIIIGTVRTTFTF
jgi:Carbohydrate-selective porin, OprB family/S-layer homology domain